MDENGIVRMRLTASTIDSDMLRKCLFDLPDAMTNSATVSIFYILHQEKLKRDETLCTFFRGRINTSSAFC